MKAKSILVSIMIATSLCLLACSPAASSEVSAEVSCDDFMEQRRITNEVEVAVDGSLTVTLCSNQTTGFQWSESAQISDQTILQQIDHKYVPSEAENIVGGCWQRSMDFQGTQERYD